jgi:hypothetical protein
VRTEDSGEGEEGYGGRWGGNRGGLEIEFESGSRTREDGFVFTGLFLSFLGAIYSPLKIYCVPF